MIYNRFSLSLVLLFFFKAVGNNMEALATRLQNAASVVVSLNPTSKTIRCNDDQGNNDDSIEDEKNRNTKCIAGTLESLVRFFIEFYLRNAKVYIFFCQ